MYAVVDIETTGSNANLDAIMEIAIVLYDGNQIEGYYNELINPEIPIPAYVSRLTGITYQMLGNKPTFHLLAPEIYRQLQGRIFVAHNVQFDYAFLQHHLALEQLTLAETYLCTLALARKAFPNFTKHGLESLTKSLDIDLKKHHRALSDAMATTQILDRVLKNGGERLVHSMLVKSFPKKRRKILL